MQRPAQLQRSALPGGGQDRSAHTQTALLSRGRMGMDSRVRLVRSPRAQSGSANVLWRAAPENRAPFSTLQFWIRRLAFLIRKI